MEQSTLDPLQFSLIETCGTYHRMNELLKQVHMISHCASQSNDHVLLNVPLLHRIHLYSQVHIFVH